MEFAKKYIASPEQKTIKIFTCEGCKQSVEQKELTIPIGPRKGLLPIMVASVKTWN